MAMVMRLDGRDHHLEIIARWPRLVLRIDGELHVIQSTDRDADGDCVVVDGRSLRYVAAGEGTAVHVRRGGRSHRVEIPDPRDVVRSSAAKSDEIVAEMPGTLVAIVKPEGAEVQAGDIVATVESMKLQMHLVAPRAGRVARITVNANQTFDKGATLVVLEAAQED